MNLSWAASTDNGGGTVAGYKIYRDTALVATVTSGTSYSVDPGLPVSYNFTNPDVSAWVNVDNSGITSNWQVTAGAYNQSVDVGDQDFGTPFDKSYKLGTYSYLTGLATATGYSVSVDITPLKDIPSRAPFDGQDVGVMFRYQDTNNYYRVSFSSRESFARLEKKVGGVFTTPPCVRIVVARGA